MTLTSICTHTTDGIPVILNFCATRKWWIGNHEELFIKNVGRWRSVVANRNLVPVEGLLELANLGETIGENDELEEARDGPQGLFSILSSFAWDLVGLWLTTPYSSSSLSIIELLKSVMVGGAESGVGMTSDMDFEWLRE